MVEVPLANGRGVALVDDEDAGRVLGHRWYRHEVKGCIYARSRQAGYLHRIVAGLQRGDGLEVDHISGDGLDNRRSNLRVLTHAQNQQNRNRQANRTSQYRGVTYARRRVRDGKAPWVARVVVGGVSHQAGYYWTDHEAGAAAADLRRELMPYATS